MLPLMAKSYYGIFFDFLIYSNFIRIFSFFFARTTDNIFAAIAESVMYVIFFNVNVLNLFI